MRRRTKRGPNTSESTGKIGQEIRTDQPAPIRPAYPDELPAHSAVAETDENRTNAEAAVTKPVLEPRGAEEGSEQADARLPEHGTDSTLDAIRQHNEAHPQGKLEVETQPESPSIPPPEPQAAKSPRGYVVLTIGLPGSGKTTWFKRRSVTPLSSDMLRNILFDDITEQRYQGLVFSTLRSLLRARLIAKMPWNYVDATNLSPHERRQWIKMAKSFGYDVHAVFFDVPLALCMERNHNRERTVSDDIMMKMAERLRPPSFKEGFSKITVVRVKGAPPAETAAAEV